MQQGKVQETELIPVYPGRNKNIMIYFQIPAEAFFPDIPFGDAWLIRCDTQEAEFLSLEPLKRILRIDGVETLKVEDGNLWIWKGMLFSWKDIVPRVEDVLKQEISRNISLAIDLLSSEIVFKESITTIIGGNDISCYFKKRASYGCCYIEKRKNIKFISSASELGESLLQVFLSQKWEWIEEILLLPYALDVITSTDISNHEKGVIKEQIETIIAAYEKSDNPISV